MELPEVPSWNPTPWSPALCSSSSQKGRSPAPGWIEGRENCGYLVSVWQVQATGRNPEGWQDWLWLDAGVISWGTVWQEGLRVVWHLHRCSKGGMELSLSMGQNATAKSAGITTPGLCSSSGCVRGKEGRWIRVTRATSCLLFLAPTGATQLYSYTVRQCAAGKNWTYVPLLILFHSPGTHLEKEELKRLTA